MQRMNCSGVCTGNFADDGSFDAWAVAMSVI